MSAFAFQLIVVFGTAQGMPFQQIKHIVTEQDIQPTIDNSILIMVFGQLKVSATLNVLTKTGLYFNNYFGLSENGLQC